MTLEETEKYITDTLRERLLGVVADSMETIEILKRMLEDLVNEKEVARVPHFDVKVDPENPDVFLVTPLTPGARRVLEPVLPSTPAHILLKFPIEKTNEEPPE